MITRKKEIKKGWLVERYAKFGLYKWSTDESGDDNIGISLEKKEFKNSPKPEARDMTALL